MHRNQNFEKVTYVFRLLVLITVFLPFLFLLFFIFWLQRLTLYWACFSFKYFRESIIETGNFCYGVAMFSGIKFYSVYFTQICEHFCAYIIQVIKVFSWNTIRVGKVGSTDVKICTLQYLCFLALLANTTSLQFRDMPSQFLGVSIQKKLGDE